MKPSFIGLCSFIEIKNFLLFNEVLIEPNLPSFLPAHPPGSSATPVVESQGVRSLEALGVLTAKLMAPWQPGFPWWAAPELGSVGLPASTAQGQPARLTTS